MIIINGKRYFAWRARQLHSSIVLLPRNSIFSISSSPTSSATRFVLRFIATTPLFLAALNCLQFVVLMSTALPYFRFRTVAVNVFSFFFFFFILVYVLFFFLAYAFSCSVCEWCSLPFSSPRLKIIIAVQARITHTFRRFPRFYASSLNDFIFVLFFGVTQRKIASACHVIGKRQCVTRRKPYKNANLDIFVSRQIAHPTYATPWALQIYNLRMERKKWKQIGAR